jgi:hypothetical protein
LRPRIVNTGSKDSLGVVAATGAVTGWVTSGHATFATPIVDNATNAIVLIRNPRPLRDNDSTRGRETDPNGGFAKQRWQEKGRNLRPNARPPCARGEAVYVTQAGFLTHASTFALGLPSRIFQPVARYEDELRVYSGATVPELHRLPD